MSSLNIPEVILVQTGRETVEASWSPIPGATSYQYRFAFVDGDGDEVLPPIAFGSTTDTEVELDDRSLGDIVRCTVRALDGAEPGAEAASRDVRVEPWVPSRHLVVVPLPHGRVAPGGDGLLSVLLIPRLEMDGRLTHFREWGTWPQWMAANLELTVLINGTATSENTDIAFGDTRWLSAAPRLDLWQALFRTATPQQSARVERFRFVDERNIELAPLYEGPEILRELRKLYDRVAKEYPLVPPSRGQITALPEFTAVRSMQARATYREHMQPTAEISPTTPQRDPRLADFHRSIGYLMAYPDLLRRIGLLVDLQVRLPPTDITVNDVGVRTNYQPAAVLFPSLSLDSRAFWQYSPSDPDQSVFERVRAVHCRVRTSDSFLPAEVPPPGDNVQRSAEFFGLINSDHVPDIVDIGDAVAELDDFLGRYTGTGDPDAPDPVDLDPASELAPTLPAESGVHVVRRPNSLRNEFDARRFAGFEVWDAMVKNEGPFASLPLIELDARGIRTGWRYDILDVTADPELIDGTWRSLFVRGAPKGYGFLAEFGIDPTIVPPMDEAWMSYGGYSESLPVFVSPQHPPPGIPSLEIAVPPGLPRVEDHSAMRVSPVVFRWAGWSLAAPQPGRALDGALGAVNPSSPAPSDDGSLPMQIDFEVPDGVLPLLRYGRIYRVRARWVDLSGWSRALTDPVPGEDAVTRPIRFARTARIEPPLLVRRLVPPQPSIADTADVLVVRTLLSQSSSDAAPTVRVIVPPQSAQIRCELHGHPGPDGIAFDEPTFNRLVARDASSVDDMFDTDPTSGELISPASADLRPAIPYLADVAADGVAFQGLPGGTPMRTVAFGGAWPDRSGTAVELIGAPALGSQLVAGGDGDPALRIALPQGYTRHVEVSCSLPDDVLDHFDVAWRLQQELPPAGWPQARQGILDGLHWMVSGRRRMTVIHAVPLPLTVPEIDADPTVADDPAIIVGRQLGEPMATLTFPLLFDRKSTGQVDVLARTSFPVDTSGVDGGVEERVVDERVLRMPFDYAETTSESAGGTFRAGTERRRVQLRLEAIARYWRHFPELAGTPNSRLSTEVDASAGTWEVTLPNTAVPDPVDVVEALPAFSRFSWGDLGDPDGITVQHSGAVIRVWIARPWFTTGVDERLAVVCTPRTFPETPAQLVASARWSRAARDPLASTISPRGFEPSNFVRSFDEAHDVPLSPVDVVAGETERVDLALHEVRFDDERELWYADIEFADDLEAGSSLGYRPFVQLAVARYQEVSVDGAHLGPVTMLETMRLGPIRETEVALVSGGAAASVRVRGAAIANGNGDGSGHEVRATLQRSLPWVGDRALSWEDVGDPVLLTLGSVGEVPIPPDIDDDLRVVIEDAEILDRQSPGPDGEAVETRNIVYIETVELQDSPAPPADPPVPPPIGAVSAVVSGPTSVTVSWPAPPAGAGVLEFAVQRQRVGASAWVNVGRTEGTSIEATDLQPGLGYRFRVRARLVSGFGPWFTSAPVTLPGEATLPPPSEPPPPPPPAVASVTVTISEAGLATVSWPPLPASISGVQYQVQYSRDGGPFVFAGLTAATSLEVPGLQPGTYVFRLRPRVGQRTGPWLTADAVVHTGGADVAPYDPVVPSRILDTRLGIGVAEPGKLGDDSLIVLQVAGRGGVPATGAGAVAINLTAVDASRWTFLTAWPTGARQPDASVLNPPPGGTSTNFVVVPIGPDGTISIYNFRGEVDVLGDVMGWFPTGSVYGRVVPNRVLDTRNGTGVDEPGRIGPGETIDLRVAGRAGLPRSGVGAVAINLTGVDATEGTFLSAWPKGVTQPDASVLNPPPSTVVTNFLIVPVGDDGSISIYNHAGEVHVLGDVMGFFPAGQTYGTVSPSRVLDTRIGTGRPAPGPIGPETEIEIQVVGRGGLPSSGVGAVAINLTAVDATEGTFVSAWPTGVLRPDSSVLNPAPGQPATNFIVVPVGSNGTISLYNFAGEVHLLGDVMGWFPTAN